MGKLRSAGEPLNSTTLIFTFTNLSSAMSIHYDEPLLSQLLDVKDR